MCTFMPANFVLEETLDLRFFRGPPEVADSSHLNNLDSQILKSASPCQCMFCTGTGNERAETCYNSCLAYTRKHI